MGADLSVDDFDKETNQRVSKKEERKIHEIRKQKQMAEMFQKPVVNDVDDFFDAEIENMLAQGIIPPEYVAEKDADKQHALRKTTKLITEVPLQAFQPDLDQIY